jgi:hypothetical protein
MVCNLKESMQTMTAVGSFKVKKLKKKIEGFDTLLIDNILPINMTFTF